MDRTVDTALRIVEGLGPPGAIIAGIIVACVLALIVFVQSAGLFESVRRDRQSTGVMDRLIAQYDKVAAAETALRVQADRIEAENDALKDRTRELQTSVELLRVQLRRAIDLLREVQAGKVEPAAIETKLQEIA